MLDPFSDLPAHRALLACVGGVNINHVQADSLAFVLDKGLKLSESPTMQPRSDSLSGFNVGADVC